jgi:hypothetical protein
MSYVMWLEEHLRNVSVLQGERLSSVRSVVKHAISGANVAPTSVLISAILVLFMVGNYKLDNRYVSSIWCPYQVS